MEAGLRTGIAIIACLALAGAAKPANAQDAAAETAGGDVTADEASPLPPVTVQSAREPVRARARRRRASTPASQPAQAPSSPSQQAAAQSATAAASSGGGAGGVDTDFAGDGEAYTQVETTPAVGVFTLGQLDSIGGSTITNDAMWTFSKQSLDQAVNILPGVSLQSSGNSRNERDIYVRGFDRFRVPLYVDGVRIYLPADNRLDLNRFLTADLAEVQVQKGYVSVLNGPGGSGGAINLVSRKPTKEVELEGRAGAVFNGDLDDLNQWSSYAFAGTRQKGYYAQLSGTVVDQDHFSLSNDFSPASPATTPGYLAGYPYEDGGARDRSYFKDYRVNAKAGITPNATDEYSINYTYQAADKGAPLHTDRQVVQGYFFGGNERHWAWPKYDISSLSWLSKTQIGDSSYIKTNAYYNTFENTLYFHNDRSYTTRIIDSIYDDHNYGGFIEMGTSLIPMNTLKGAIHFRRDVHNEWDLEYDTAVNIGQFLNRTPTETSEEETWSFAIENTFHATRNLDIVAGVSYDRNRVVKAEFLNDDPPNQNNPIIDEYAEKPNIGAWNWQTAAILSYSDTGKAHASVSSRTRFATLFDRYSTRFGTRDVNPGLDPERATNYEVGIADTVFGNVRVASAVFYSDIEDSIQNAFYAANGQNSIIGYNANGRTYGFEFSADWDVSTSLRVGGNYTYLNRDFDYADAARNIEPLASPALTTAARNAVRGYEAEGTPSHKLFLYAAWEVTPKLTLTPSMEIASDRTVLITNCNSTLVRPGNAQTSGRCNPPPRTQAETRPNFTDIGSFALVNMRADYAFTDNFDAAIGVTNLFDQNYSLAQGFPEPGRQFFVTMRARF